MNNIEHISVLSKEVIDNLALEPGMTVIDGTLGGAGHSFAIAEIIGKSGTLIGFDLDQNAIDRASEKLSGKCNLHLLKDNFRNMKVACKRLAIDKVDAILLDLGVSSYEIGPSGRGFSFQYNEPLLMTFESEPKTGQVTARDAVNDWAEDSLATIFKGFGGERHSKMIARAIVEARKVRPINTTFELAHLIESKVRRSGKLHPATKVFQALRMAVNDELGALKQAVVDGTTLLNPNGRFAIISFHEGEDRIVKHEFKKLDMEGAVLVLTKKPVVPMELEIKSNPRSRSAKLRVISKK